MSWTAFDELLRAHFEPLQYAAFFASLIALGALEATGLRCKAAAPGVRRWGANAGLTVLNILVLGAIPLGAVAVADLAAVRGAGLLNQLSLGPIAALLLTVALRSLAGYAIHVAMHKLPVLWRVHRVHHTDPLMDVSTTVRFHPLEFAISVPVIAALTWALGLSPLGLMVYEVVDAMMAVFTHANLRLPDRLDRALCWLLVTPGMHRIHHSAHQPETDSNYGATLSLWDRLFGTYRAVPGHALAGLRLGLEGWDPARAASLWRLLWLPFGPLGARSLAQRAT